MGYKLGLTGCCCGCAGGTAFIEVFFTNCFASVSGATVSVTGPGGFSGSGATSGSSPAIINVPTTGTYTYTISYGGITVHTDTVNVTSCGTFIVTWNTSWSHIEYAVTVCGWIMPGASVQFTVGGVTYGPVAMTSLTQEIYIPNGVTTVVVTTPPLRGTTGTFTFTPSACFLTIRPFDVLPASGYTCYCGYPVADALFVSESSYGTTSSINSGGSTWTGSSPGLPFPGCGYDVNETCPPASVVLNWTLCSTCLPDPCGSMLGVCGLSADSGQQNTTPIAEPGVNCPDSGSGTEYGPFVMQTACGPFPVPGFVVTSTPDTGFFSMTGTFDFNPGCPAFWGLTPLPGESMVHLTLTVSE